MTTQTPTFTPFDTINAIVLRQPAALTVLHQFGLDTCCGGTLALAEAAARHGLDVHEILRALDALRQPEDQR